MVWDIKTPTRSKQERKLRAERKRVNKFFGHLKTRGGVVGDKAVLFVYNEDSPELSYILTETL